MVRCEQMASVSRRAARGPAAELKLTPGYALQCRLVHHTGTILGDPVLLATIGIALALPNRGLLTLFAMSRRAGCGSACARLWFSWGPGRNSCKRGANHHSP
jgi:hypothetical protein